MTLFLSGVFIGVAMSALALVAYLLWFGEELDLEQNQDN